MDDLAKGRPIRKTALAARQKLRRWLNPSENFVGFGECRDHDHERIM